MVWKECPVHADVFSWEAKTGSHAKAAARAATPRPGKKIVVGMPGRKKITTYYSGPAGKKLALRLGCVYQGSMEGVPRFV
jgi:hypothetical protein